MGNVSSRFNCAVYPSCDHTPRPSLPFPSGIDSSRTNPGLFKTISERPTTCFTSTLNRPSFHAVVGGSTGFSMSLPIAKQEATGAARTSEPAKRTTDEEPKESRRKHALPNKVFTDHLPSDLEIDVLAAFLFLYTERVIPSGCFSRKSHSAYPQGSARVLENRSSF